MVLVLWGVSLVSVAFSAAIILVMLILLAI